MMQAAKVIVSNNYSVLTCCLREPVDRGKIEVVSTRSTAVPGHRWHWRNILRYGAAVDLIPHQHRFYSAEAALSTPTPDGVPKVYPEKIQSIVSEITKLTVLEVADLNDLLKRTLNISDAPVMAFGAGMPAAAPAQEEDEEEAVGPAKVQTSFTVKMNKFDAAKKVAVIKEVKALLEGFNLVQAKKFVESCPTVVKEDIPKDEAEKLAEALNAAGAECVVE